MKYHRHLVDSVLAALEVIFVQSIKADKVIERSLKSQKKWGARDRKFFAESVYEIVRSARLLAAYVGLDDQIFLDSSLWRPNDFWGLWTAWILKKNHVLPPWPKVQNFKLCPLDPSWPRTTKLSLSDGLDELGISELGDDWESLVTALNRPADVYIRANTLLTTPEKLKQRLAEEEVQVEIVDKNKTALILSERKNIFRLTSFKEGLFEVQDLSSQEISLRVDPQPKDRIIDACAGGGGKSLHLATLMQNKGKILSLDIYEKKLAELKIRARRNKIDIIETRWIENSKTIKRLDQSADRVLLDVPCTGSGVLRRNPDAKWKINSTEMNGLLEIQAEILQSYSAMVKPGGRLVYATCSIFPSENQKQIEKFLNSEKGKNWTLVSEEFLDPRKMNCDGFFVAVMARNK